MKYIVIDGFFVCYRMDVTKHERLVAVLRKFLAHPAKKTHGLVAEFIRLLEKMLPTEETCNVDAGV